MENQEFVALLRGINVSGRKPVRMDALKALFGGLGFMAVDTVIQSGNVRFTEPGGEGEDVLASRIAEAAGRSFGFPVGVLLRTREDLRRVALGNPFIARGGVDPLHLHVTFLDRAPDTGAVRDLEQRSFPPDAFEIREREVYLHCPAGYARTTLSNAFFEKKLSVAATTRNWKTVLKLAE
ncbi:MAG: DUF1697 domain-containing protein [Acidobacteria bacterium]|nr:DUF1697 domain-containing protein [Acidobacteriota bacterium]